jgi:hypothetical protein
MIPLRSIQRGEFNCDIWLRTFVNVTMYPQYNNNITEKKKKKKKHPEGLVKSACLTNMRP